MKKISAILLLWLLAFGATAQTGSDEKEKVITTRILFLFDASQSMYGRWQSDMKITIARKIMSDLLDSLRDVPNLELALRCYGHTKDYPPQDCDDTRLEVPFGPDNIEKIKYKLKTINPRGTTPIAMSLERAGGDFPPGATCRNIIILITDGLEECNGDPCAVSLALQKKGIILKPFIIGIGKSFKEQFDCVGTYFDATTEKQFSTALNIVINPIICIVRENGKMNTLNAQFMYTREKYICGLYDLEIMTLPRTYVENVRIDQSTTTFVEIPSAGTTIFQFPASGYGSLYLKKDNKLEWVYNFRGTGEQEVLMLQPGE